MARPQTSHSVSEYMTRCPVTVGSEQPLTYAHAVMRKRRIRHLPVLHGGKLVGIVSMRDLHLIETLPGVEADQVSVEDAMSTEVFKVSPEADLRTVAREMAKRKLGSAIVAKGDHVEGVFTTVDALRALEDALGSA